MFWKFAYNYGAQRRTVSFAAHKVIRIKALATAFIFASSYALAYARATELSDLKT